jgi:hypothetical protein
MTKVDHAHKDQGYSPRQNKGIDLKCHRIGDEAIGTSSKHLKSGVRALAHL